MTGKKRTRKAPLGPSRGLGDTIAKFTRATYLDALVEVYSGLTGRPCNCEKRRQTLNRLVPYRRKPPAPELKASVSQQGAPTVPQ
jgi:hypothetical protein